MFILKLSLLKQHFYTFFYFQHNSIYNKKVVSNVFILLHKHICLNISNSVMYSVLICFLENPTFLGNKCNEFSFLFKKKIVFVAMRCKQCKAILNIYIQLSYAQFSLYYILNKMHLIIYKPLSSFSLFCPLIFYLSSFQLLVYWFCIDFYRFDQFDTFYYFQH